MLPFFESLPGMCRNEKFHVFYYHPRTYFKSNDPTAALRNAIDKMCSKLAQILVHSSGLLLLSAGREEEYYLPIVNSFYPKGPWEWSRDGVRWIAWKPTHTWPILHTRQWTLEIVFAQRNFFLFFLVHNNPLPHSEKCLKYQLYKVSRLKSLSRTMDD